MQPKSRNILLDTLKLIVTLFVVCLHCRFLYDKNEMVYEIFANGMFKIAVPFFLCINGFFLFSVFRKEQIFTWIKRIFILYGVWMLFYGWFWITPRKPLKMISTVFFGFNHLWYLVALLIAGYLLYKIKDLSNSLLISIAVFLYLVGTTIQYLGIFDVFSNSYVMDKMVNYPPSFRNFLFYALPFLIIGFLIKRNNIHTKLSKPLVAVLVLFSLLLLAFDGTVNSYFVDYGYLLNMNLSFLLCAPMLLIFAFKFQLNSNFDSKLLSLYSIAIYLIHPFIIYLLHTGFELKPSVLTFATITLSFLSSYFLIQLNKRIRYLL